MSNLASSQPLSLPPSRRVTLKLGSYRPCLEIGSGGMATVYLAREASEAGLQRMVALKVMHDHLSRTDRYKKRFLDEARILSRLAHPYVCRVFGYGEEDGRPFMAMEYLIGEPLSRMVRAVKHRGANLRSADRARIFARVIADIAEGIHAAHETRDGQGRLLGVVHRDVSPQNLFVLYDGTVRILDFGIAWYRDRYVQTATTSRLIGKLPYMAPEQIQGTPYDRRVDVWALGVVLWELITLERLFRRETEVRTMDAVCSEPILPLSEVIEGVPPGLDPIMARVLERDPERRYQTARELSHDLELWLSKTGQPVTHADLGRVLGELFPGSEHERRRWAEVVEPNTAAPQFIPQIDFASEALGMLEISQPSLSLPMRLPREEDLISTEYTPPPEYNRIRHATAEYDASSLIGEESIETEDWAPISAPPETNASPVAISVREPAPNGPVSAATGRHWWSTAVPALALVFGVAVGGKYSASVSGSDAEVASVAAAAPARETEVRAAAPHAATIEPAAPNVQRPTPIPGDPAGEVTAFGFGREAERSLVISGAAAPELAVRAATADADPPPRPAVPAAPSAASARRPAAPALLSVAAPDTDSRPSTTAAGLASPANGTESAAAGTAPLGSGDVLVVTATPGMNVYLGEKLIGQTPLRTRLPVGVAHLSVQVRAGGNRTPITAAISPGRLNIVSLR